MPANKTSPSCQSEAVNARRRRRRRAQKKAGLPIEGRLTPDEKHQSRWRNYAGHMLRTARRRAAKSGLEFTISIADLVIPTHCPVLGIKLKMQRHLRGHANWAAPSLDRIHNSLGYVPGNVVVVSNRVNLLKSNASIDELIAIASFYRRFK